MGDRPPVQNNTSGASFLLFLFDVLSSDNNTSSANSPHLKNTLTDIYSNRISVAIEKLKNNSSFGRYCFKDLKVAFLFAFSICEIHIYERAKQYQIRSHYRIPKDWTDYIELLKSTNFIDKVLNEHSASIKPILNELTRKLIYAPNISLHIYFKQAPITDTICELFSALLPMMPAYARTPLIFDFQYKDKNFSWAGANPWIAMHRKLFFANSVNEQEQEDWMLSDNAVGVNLMHDKDKQKKITLYAKSEEVLRKKIEVIVNWAKSIDPDRVIPGNHNIQAVKYLHSPLEILLHKNIKKQSCKSYDKNWYSINISPILPPMISTIFGQNPYGSNCHGGALFTLGITSIPRRSSFPPINDRFESIMEPVTTGYLQTGDMIHLCGIHSLVYLDPDITLEINGFRAHYQIISLAETLRSTCKDGHDGYLKGLRYDYKPNIDFTKTPISELLKQPLLIYRKRKNISLQRDKSVLSSIQRITELLLKYPDFNTEKSFIYQIDKHPKYTEMLQAYEELINKTANHPELSGDRYAIESIIPDSIKNQDTISRKRLNKSTL